MAHNTTFTSLISVQKKNWRHRESGASTSDSLHLAKADGISKPATNQLLSTGDTMPTLFYKSSANDVGATDFHRLPCFMLHDKFATHTPAARANVCIQ